MRSSPRLNERLLRTRMLGGILRDWQQLGGVRPHVKLKAVAIVTIAAGVTLYFSVLPFAAKAIFAVLAAAGIYVIGRLPTARD